MLPSEPQTSCCGTFPQSVGQSSGEFPATLAVRCSCDMQYDIGTSKICLPQLAERILHDDAYTPDDADKKKVKIN